MGVLHYACQIYVICQVSLGQMIIFLCMFPADYFISIHYEFISIPAK